MHETALHKVIIFLSEYVINDSEPGSKKVLDVGACLYSNRRSPVRDFCERSGIQYVGLDIVTGPNVDVATKNPFVWDEIENESFDYIVSTSTFEHNPFFWVTFCEMARVLKQTGRVLVTAPGAGAVHRFPLDCWRFYPDSWAVLCKLTGLAVDEVIQEPKASKGVLKGSSWSDSLIIASKPAFMDPKSAAEFYSRLEPLVQPYSRFGLDFEPAEINNGPIFRKYVQFVGRQAALQQQEESVRN